MPARLQCHPQLDWGSSIPKAPLYICVNPQVAFSVRMDSDLKEKQELVGNLNGGSNGYKKALAKWRAESKSLFENPDDAEFMEHAFDKALDKEAFKEKDILNP